MDVSVRHRAVAKKTLAGALSAVIVLLSPGWECYQALAAQSAAESTKIGMEVRTGSPNLAPGLGRLGNSLTEPLTQSISGVTGVTELQTIIPDNLATQPNIFEIESAAANSSNRMSFSSGLAVESAARDISLPTNHDAAERSAMTEARRAAGFEEASKSGGSSTTEHSSISAEDAVDAERAAFDGSTKNRASFLEASLAAAKAALTATRFQITSRAGTSYFHSESVGTIEKAIVEKGSAQRRSRYSTRAVAGVAATGLAAAALTFVLPNHASVAAALSEHAPIASSAATATSEASVQTSVLLTHSAALGFALGHFFGFFPLLVASPGHIGRQILATGNATFSKVQSWGREVREMFFGDPHSSVRPITAIHHKHAWFTGNFPWLGVIPWRIVDGVLTIGLVLLTAELFKLNSPSASVLFEYLAGASILYGVYTWVEYTHHIRFDKLLAQIIRDIRVNIVRSLMRQEYRFFQQPENDSGGLARRVLEDPIGFARKELFFKLAIYRELVVLAIVAVALYSIGVPILTLPVAVVMGISGLVLIKTLYRAYELEDENDGLAARIDGYTSQIFKAIGLVRHSNAIEEAVTRHDNLAQEVATNERARVRQQIANFKFLNYSTTDIAYYLIPLVGGFLIAMYNGKTLTMASLVKIMLFSSILKLSVAVFWDNTMAYFSGKGQSRTSRELFVRTPEIRNRPNATSVGPDRIAMRLEDVTFAYPGREPVLRHLSLEIPAGKTTAIVGRIGSGKSTLVRMLLRLIDPTSPDSRVLIGDGGNALVDADLRDVNLESLRSRIAYVPQNPLLGTATVREIMRYGKPDATDAEMTLALRRAKADFLFDNPRFNGLDTHVWDDGPGAPSGGERQRLGIARALVRSPSLLILDEATSKLDMETESAFQSMLADLQDEGLSVVVIAHRLDTVRHADSINVLDGGRIVESGTHEELLARGGDYAALVAAAKEGLLGDGGKAAHEDESRADVAGAGTQTAESAETAETGVTGDDKSLVVETRASVGRRAWDWVRQGSKEFKSVVAGDEEAQRVLRKFRKSIWEARGLIFLNTTLMAGTALWLKPYLQKVAEIVAGDADFASNETTLLIWGAGILALFIGFVWTKWHVDRLIGESNPPVPGDLVSRIKWELRADLLNRLIRQPLVFIKNQTTEGNFSQFANRLANDVGNLAVKNVTIPLLLFQSGLAALFGGITMVAISGFYGLLVFAPIPVLGYLGYRYAARTNKIAVRKATVRNSMDRMIKSEIFGLNMEMIETVQAFGREKAEADRLSALANEYADLDYQEQVFKRKSLIVSSSVTDFFVKFAPFLVGVCLGLPWDQILPVVILAGQVQPAFSGVMTQLGNLPSYRGGTEILRQWLELPLETDPPGARVLPEHSGSRRVEFKGVSFKPAGVSDASFTVEPGQTLAIMGHSNSGKTTLLNLLLKDISPTRGAVSIDGQDVAVTSYRSLYDNIAVVPQETELLDESIESNIRFGAPSNLKPEELERTVRLVYPQFLDDKKSFPQGLGTRAKVSGGQGQLIAIIRAMLRRPKVLLLDEPTSNVDAETKIPVLEALQRVSSQSGPEKPTILIVAHDPQTILNINPDSILVMEGGKLKERIAPQEFRRRLSEQNGAK